LNDPQRLARMAEAEGVEIFHELTVNKEQRIPDIGYWNIFPGWERDQIDPDARMVWGQEFHTSYWGHRGILHLKDQLLLPGYAAIPTRQQGVCIR